MNLTKKVKQLFALGLIVASAACATVEPEDIEVYLEQTRCQTATVEEAYIEVESYESHRYVDAFVFYSDMGQIGIALGFDQSDYRNVDSVAFTEQNLRKLVFDYNQRHAEQATICTIPNPLPSFTEQNVEKVVTRIEFQDGTTYDASTQ